MSSKRKRSSGLSDWAKRYKTKSNMRTYHKKRYVQRTPGGAITAENKYFSTYHTTTTVPAANSDWTGTEFYPNNTGAFFSPTQGAAIEQRIGRQATLKTLRIKGLIYQTESANQSDPPSQQIVRVILAHDMQANASQAQGENIMVAASANVNSVFTGFMSVDNLGRFKILHDKIYKFTTPAEQGDGASTGAYQQLCIPFKISKRWKKGLVVHFNNVNGGTYADIVDHNFVLLAVTINQQTGNTGTTVVLHYSARCSFTD